MMYALKLMVVLLVSVTACAVDSGTQLPENAALSTLSSELSVADSGSASDTSAITQDVTCSSVWECDEICGFFNSNGILVRYSTNVLHKYCSDGSDTIVRTDPCGEACF